MEADAKDAEISFTSGKEKLAASSDAKSHTDEKGFLEMQEIAEDSETAYSSADGEDGVVNPWLLKFLDADTMEQKYQIVCDIKSDITDRLIDDLAVVVDVVIPEGKVSDRYEQLKYCIRTRQKYEKTSFR